jgi:hypothetical protein
MGDTGNDGIIFSTLSERLASWFPISSLAYDSKTRVGTFVISMGRDADHRELIRRIDVHIDEQKMGIPRQSPDDTAFLSLQVAGGRSFHFSSLDDAITNILSSREVFTNNVNVVERPANNITQQSR